MARFTAKSTQSGEGAGLSGWRTNGLGDDPGQAPCLGGGLGLITNMSLDLETHCLGEATIGVSAGFGIERWNSDNFRVEPPCGARNGGVLDQGERGDRFARGASGIVNLSVAGPKEGDFSQR
jgi:hypothetical protein